MLLIHTTGTNKIGDVRRYTITYTPSQDRILPLPKALYLKIKNTASLPLRAAYLHGPYTLYVSVRRKEFKPWPDYDGEDEDVVEEWDDEEMAPVYDPHVKAGASFYATLPVPKRLRDEVMEEFHKRRSWEYHGRMSMDLETTKPTPEEEKKERGVTWIVEVVSQVIFSTSASVPYEILLSRDEKSLSFGYPTNPPRPVSEKGVLRDDGVLSSSVRLSLQDTQELWNTPPFPRWEDKVEQDETSRNPEDQDEARERRRKKRLQRKPKKVHLVVVTHGLHSNTGADMLFIKESIDSEAAKTAKARKERRERELEEGKKTAAQIAKEEEDDELVLVRGYQDNQCNTERGIKFLGKRLAKWILHITNPHDHPPPRSGARNKLQKKKPGHHHPHLTPVAFDTLHHLYHNDPTPWKITSISFIGHSLGGLIQVYAIAYIHAHHPKFFTEAKPANFIALATPFLGLSNENPLYVKFALDFGLVGRTGQDLGLTWRAPNAFSGFTSSTAKAKQKAKGGKDNSSKPLLRILPTGPAHEVLKMFRERTVYANVVNDGIVPLRTSCLLFLDWKGLGKVDKARRENGTVSGLVEWGIGQLVTGQQGRSPRVGTTNTVTSSTVSANQGSNGVSMVSDWSSRFWGVGKSASSSEETVTASKASTSITGEPMTSEPTSLSVTTTTTTSTGFKKSPTTPLPITTDASKSSSHPLTSLLTLLRPNAGKPSSSTIPDPSNSTTTSSSSTTSPTHPPHKKPSKIYTRSQTSAPATPLPTPLTLSSPSSPPPKTTFLEAATDVLNPPLPPLSFLLSPSSRPKTIFHERVYRADDIPPIPDGMAKDVSVEEKIARAYHRDMEWRKVLVRLEPDAHNNVNVRRMLSNAYGWEVVRHLVGLHFGEQEGGGERELKDEVRLGLGLGIEQDPGEGEMVPQPDNADPGRREEDAIAAAESVGSVASIANPNPSITTGSILPTRSPSPPSSSATPTPLPASKPPSSAKSTPSTTSTDPDSPWSPSAWNLTDDSDSGSSSSHTETLTRPPRSATFPTNPFSPTSSATFFGFHNPFTSLSLSPAPPPPALSSSLPNISGATTIGVMEEKRRSQGLVGVERVVGVGLSAGLGARMGDEGYSGAVKMLERCHEAGKRGEVRRVRGWTGGSAGGGS